MNKTVGIVIVLALVIGAYLFVSSNQQPDTAPDRTSGEMMDTRPAGEMMEKTVVIDLMSQNDSGETGTATLIETDTGTIVRIETTGAPASVPQPAHIHTGTCPDVGPVAYPLTNVVDGLSETTLDVPISQLESELPLGINIHRSAEEASVYTACGDLTF